MGGKALNKYGVFTERKNTIIYNDIKFKIIFQLNKDFKSKLKSHSVVSYHTKEDHGDLDLLIKENSDLNIDYKKYIQDTFNPREINHNANVYSFDYKNFQIDFILISEDNWEIAKTYFSYDPAGNIMGKVFHKFNLSYGWKGLEYKFRNFNGKNSKNIPISKDPRKIFEFSGYNYTGFLRGFETLEDIFKFLINNKYFSPEIFKFENLKHIDKKRNRKRVSYNVFLEYINKKNIKSRYEFHKNKDVYLKYINMFFPEAKLLRKLEELKLEDERNKLLSAKFNGNIIMKHIPQLSGKLLGKSISNFKENLSDNYEDFILNADEEKIIEMFKSVNKIKLMKFNY